MSSKVTFTFEEDSLLADYVSRRPCLYDLQHNAYKDIHIKENVWKEISTRLKKSENVLLEQETMWFLWLDYAPPHHTNTVRQLLHYLFPDKLIDIQAGNNAQYGPDITWPHRSPDFNPCDFFHMGFYERTSLL
ncbi:hypothetical protein QTP88_003067 [Uroleucon formosanum]